MAIGIMFHHFYDNLSHKKSQGALTAEDFDKSIHYLKKNYTILSAHEYYYRFSNKKLNANQICFTFDDNLKCQFDIALPVMENHGITAFWFINTGPIVNLKEKTEMYRYFRTNYYENLDAFYSEFINHTMVYEGLTSYELLNIEEQANKYYEAYSFYSKNDKIFRFLRDWFLGKDKYQGVMENLLRSKNIDLENSGEISNLWMTENNISHLHNKEHIIGLHSHSHPTELKQLEESEQVHEYIQNIEILEKITKVRPYTISHPCNSYNDTTLQLLNKMGIQLGFRDNSMQTSYTSLEYPRIDIADVMKKI